MVHESKKKKKFILINRLIKIIPLSLSLSHSLSSLNISLNLTLSLQSLISASHSGLSLSHSGLSLSQLRSPKPSLSLRSLTLSTPITQVVDPPLLLNQLVNVIDACSSWGFFYFFLGTAGGGCGRG